VNANQATKEPKISPAVNGNPMLAAQPADDPGALVELHDDDEADDARPLAADDEEDEDESPAPERAAAPQALPGAPGGADPALQTAPRDPGTDWTSIEVPEAMINGPKSSAVTHQGSQYIIVSANWQAGIWRYVEP